jgi:uncharacterized membrane protein YphA (DoxX/SURF4 family)
MTYVLWIIQALLGLLFLFSGAMKFVMPVAEMTKDMPSMPGWFLHFIGVMEILGGLGLILPSLLRIRPVLTPLAAAGLVIIMSGATAITLGTMGVGAAVLPLIVGILCAFVAYGRWRVAPLSARG